MPDTETVTINIKLTPKGSKNAIQGWANDVDGNPVLKVMVTTPPEKGKANKALIALLAKEWSIAKSQITITSGETSRNKVVKISGIKSGAIATPFP